MSKLGPDVFVVSVSRQNFISSGAASGHSWEERNVQNFEYYRKLLSTVVLKRKIKKKKKKICGFPSKLTFHNLTSEYSM